MGFCPIFQMKLNDDDQEQKGWNSDAVGLEWFRYYAQNLKF